MSSGGGDLWHMPHSCARSYINKTAGDRCVLAATGASHQTKYRQYNLGIFDYYSFCLPEYVIPPAGRSVRSSQCPLFVTHLTLRCEHCQWRFWQQLFFTKPLKIKAYFCQYFIVIRFYLFYICNFCIFGINATEYDPAVNRHTLTKLRHAASIMCGCYVMGRGIVFSASESPVSDLRCLSRSISPPHLQREPSPDWAISFYLLSRM